jgi:hypothetical protein
MEELAGPWDFIYSTTLLATLSDEEAITVLCQAAKHLTPGGVLLFANAKPGADSGKCACCAGKQRRTRSERELAMLASAVPEASLTAQLVFADSAGLNAYIELVAANDRAPANSIGVICSAV